MRTDIRLGKNAKRTDPRTFPLRRYLTRVASILLPPPLHREYVMAVPNWPMYMNDTLGDCVIAAAAHSIGQRSYLASKQEILLTDADILKGYEDVGGYDPNAQLNPDGSNPTDNGCVMLTALNYWRQTGFAGHKILGYVELNPQNLTEIEQAIAIFGNAYIGIQLPLAVQSANYWTAPPNIQGDWAPGSWGGHCVPLCSYDQRAFCCVTWGQRLDLDRGFIPAYCDEAYATISVEWMKKTGLSVSGFNMSQLEADLAAL